MCLVLVCFLFPQSLHDFFLIHTVPTHHTHTSTFAFDVYLCFCRAGQKHECMVRVWVQKGAIILLARLLARRAFILSWSDASFRCFIQMFLLSLSDASFSCKLLCSGLKFWCCQISLKILTARLNSGVARSVRPDGLCRPLWRSVSRAFSPPLPPAPFLHFFLFPICAWVCNMYTRCYDIHMHVHIYKHQVIYTV